MFRCSADEGEMATKTQKVVTHAYVRYLQDHQKEIVSVNYIKHFNPKHDKDYAVDRAYMVKWMDANGGKKDERRDSNWFKAQILMLGGSEEELENRIEKGRVKISKVLDTSVESSSDEDISLSQIAKQRERKQDISMSKENQLKLIIEEKRRQKSPPFQSTAPKRCDELKELKRKNDVLQLQLDEYQCLNKKLQKLLHAKLDKGVIHITTSTKATKTPLSPAAASNSAPAFESVAATTSAASVAEPDEEPQLYCKSGDKIHLGSGIFIPTFKWEMLQLQKKNSIFVKNLAVSVWGCDVLKARSVDGKICPRYPESTPKPPLKVQTVKRCYVDRLKTMQLSTEEFKSEERKFKKYLTEKIMDLNRKK
ncbi:BEN domain-containing protein 5-like isoform X2 [Anneissia japonica]|uniref:BEN domain-containing protein 5-like isoform X2 n=1 Tax=Anneissia japonica TaxID=1529436 RepID=UPI0014257153|nr:BEN domain-containing protein 5-like isoform X2 [Anneissia japonica]